MIIGPLRRRPLNPAQRRRAIAAAMIAILVALVAGRIAGAKAGDRLLWLSVGATLLLFAALVARHLLRGQPDKRA